MGPSGDPDPAGEMDPNAMGDDPMGNMNNGQLDPQMDNPDMDGGADMPMGDENDPNINAIMGVVKQLSPDDQDAVEAYAKSMLKRDETKMGNDGAPEGGEQPPMMESFIFTKGQLKKINENLAINEPEKDNDRLPKKSAKTKNKKSPFMGPKFN